MRRARWSTWMAFMMRKLVKKEHGCPSTLLQRKGRIFLDSCTQPDHQLAALVEFLARALRAISFLAQPSHKPPDGTCRGLSFKLTQEGLHVAYLPQTIARRRRRTLAHAEGPLVKSPFYPKISRRSKPLTRRCP